MTSSSTAGGRVPVSVTTQLYQRASERPRTVMPPSPGGDRRSPAVIRSPAPPVWIGEPPMNTTQEANA